MRSASPTHQSVLYGNKKCLKPNWCPHSEIGRRCLDPRGIRMLSREAFQARRREVADRHLPRLRHQDGVDHLCLRPSARKRRLRLPDRPQDLEGQRHARWRGLRRPGADDDGKKVESFHGINMAKNLKHSAPGGFFDQLIIRFFRALLFLLRKTFPARFL